MSVQVEPCRDREQRRPGHPDEPDVPEGFVSESAWERFKAWNLQAPAERIPLTFAATCWPATWLAHRGHMPVQDPAIASALAIAGAAIYWGYHERARAKARRDGRTGPHPRLRAAEAAGVAAAVGLWVTLAVAWGPLAGPAHLLTVLYAAGAVGGYRWLRSHHAVRAARARRDAAAGLLARKMRWNTMSRRCGLGDYLLQEVTPTNLGEEWLLTSAPGGRRAREVEAAQAGISETLAHELGLEYGRVDLRTTDLPGQLVVSVRTVDVSRQDAAYHPMTMPWPAGSPSPFADWFPPAASIRDPAIWGFCPEDGTALAVQLLSSIGGRAVGVMGKTGSGKSNLLNCLREFVTRCADARMVQLNGAHMGDELTWEPLSALTICGPVATDEEVRNKIAAALSALCLLVTNRSATLAETGHSTFQPTAEDPAVVIFIDEVDEIVKHVPGAREALEFLASKQRKSAVSLVLATQRFVIAAIGGGQVRANMSEVLIGKVDRAGETRHATGAEASIPDIREYSKGEPGYFQRWDPHAGQVDGRGRAFLLGVVPDELAYIGRLVKARIHLRDWSVPDLPPLEDLSAEASSATTEASANGSRVSALKARIAALSAAPQSGGETAQRPAPGRAPDDAPKVIPGSVPPDVMRALWPLLQNGRRVSSSQLAEKAGIGKTKAWEHLNALARAGVVVKTGGVGKASGYQLPATAPAVPAARPYVTLADLAEAARNGQVECDDEQREVLAKVYEIYHRPAAGGDMP